jgi:hypothetical protein
MNSIAILQEDLLFLKGHQQYNLKNSLKQIDEDQMEQIHEYQLRRKGKTKFINCCCGRC